MERYRCYYCPRQEQEFGGIISHLTSSHNDEVLTFREKELDSETGRFGYRTKTFAHIIPNEGEVFVTEDGKVGIYKDDRCKKSKHDSFERSDEKMDVHIQCTSSDDKPRYDDDLNSLDGEDERNEALRTLESILPRMLRNLQLSGHLQLYMKWSALIADRTFPMTNICYLLFLDLIEWYSSPTTSQMRYSRPETKTFWEVGYRLFKGKFLRFMSGPRSLGQIVSGEQEKGMCSVQDTRINFVVPTTKTLTKDKLKPIMPGMIYESMTTLAGNLPSKFFKLGIDGKKIAKGKGKEMGDINCWGFEAKPTLHERLQRYELEKTIIDKLRLYVENYQLEEDSIMPITACEHLREESIKIIQMIGMRLEDLRNISLRLDFGIRKFMTLAECISKDWKKSKYAPIISSLKVAKYDVSDAINSALELVNELCKLCSMINGTATQYTFSGHVDLSRTSYFHQLKTDIEVPDTKFVKQKSDEWFRIRNKAKVTGSTCNSALGLGRLKQQQAHYDKVVSGKEPSIHISTDQKTNMEYGSRHEIDGVATMVGRVLPALFPNLEFFEEGCATLENGEQSSFLVASPDGSFKTTLQSEPVMMFENKCKVDNPNSTPVYYSIPKYYVPQVLCEMRAYNCHQLLFSCWSTKFMTVFKVLFDEMLWSVIWKELTSLYATEKPKRPSKFSENVSTIREMINKFLQENVTLVGEFPSCFSSKEITDIQNDGGPSHTVYNRIHSEDDEHDPVRTEGVLNLIHKLLKWHGEVYNICRTSATEILMFMVNDLDRQSHIELCNAHLVAYALKGPSMSTEIFRKMVDQVIRECENRGLKIIATSSDGQWHKYGIRSSNNEPLTVLQLQKDIWGMEKSKPKHQLQKEIRNRYRVQNLDDVVFYKDPMQGTLVVEGHRHDKPFIMFMENLKNWRFNNTDKNSAIILNEHDDMEHSSVNDISSFVPETATMSLDDTESINANLILTDIDCTRTDTIPAHNTQAITPNLGNLFQELDIAGTMERQVRYENNEKDQDYIMTVGNLDISPDITSSLPSIHNSEILSQSDTLDIMRDAHTTIYGNYDFYTPLAQGCTDELITYDTDFVQTTTDPYVQPLYDEMEQNNGINGTAMETSTNNSFVELLHLLQTDSTRKEYWKKTNVDSFGLLLESKEAICKAFHKTELVMLLGILAKRENNNFTFYISWNKAKLSDLLFNAMNGLIPTTIEAESRKRIRKLNPLQLKNIASNVIGKFPKETLAIALCNDKWESKYKSWVEQTPVKRDDLIRGDTYRQWFSRPTIDVDNHVKFHFTDACHIITCLRTKLCTTGIEGLRKSAWEKAAISSETQLNIAIVIECIDKQSVAFARRIFAEDVEIFMKNNDFEKEANFVGLIRQWFEAEDEPGMNSGDRCKRRLALRHYLLQNINFGLFPPKTQYIKGIPVITFESLLVNIERKLQAYEFLPDHCYNPRSLGTQDVEQFFSTMRSLDPSGLGTPKPDDIPDMLATSEWLDRIRMDPLRPFHMRTSCNSVYPDISPDQITMDISDDTDTDDDLSPDLVKNHFFDTAARKRLKPQRKSGKVAVHDMPAHGQRGVRQYHVCDESKILAHYRRGLADV